MLQAAGLLLVLVSGFLPAVAFEAESTTRGGSAFGPYRVEEPYTARILIGVDGPQRIPLEAWGGTAASVVRGAAPVSDLWQLRPIYPHLLALIWLAAAIVALRSRRVATRTLAVWTALLIVIEAAYLFIDYEPLFGGVLGPLEGPVVFLIVLGVLLVHRHGSGAPRWRRIMGAQALLSVLHLATLPCTYARPHLHQQGLGEMLTAIGSRFGAGFWLAFAGGWLIALPVYRAARAGERPAQGL
jgi:hypothetical protein